MQEGTRGGAKSEALGSHTFLECQGKPWVRFTLQGWQGTGSGARRAGGRLGMEADKEPRARGVTGGPRARPAGPTPGPTPARGEAAGGSHRPEPPRDRPPAAHLGLHHFVVGGRRVEAAPAASAVPVAAAGALPAG